LALALGGGGNEVFDNAPPMGGQLVESDLLGGWRTISKFQPMQSKYSAEL
jgi:hypothetical protein